MTRTGLEARLISYRILDSVLKQRLTLDDAVARAKGYADLAERDRAFSRNLATTTLRRLGQIDAIIDHTLERPLTGKSKPVGHVLRLGVTQLLFLDTSAHAAVDTSVEMASRLGFTAHKKLVNAVLRRLTREGGDIVGGQDAERLNTPDWLWSSWCTAYGEDTCRRIAAAHLQEAPLDISVKSDPEAWAAKLDATVLPWRTLRRKSGGAVSSLPGFAEGAWWVQDGAARLVLTLLGDVRGKKVFDLCAAPGGKTAYLANAGADVVAIDRSEKRLQRLRENMSRLKLETTVVHADATEWKPREKADIVVADAPCSATGTIRRHPEVAWLKSPKDVEKLCTLQGRLLEASCAMVKPGGLVLYCTCSLQTEEGPAVIDRAVDHGAPLVLAPPDLGRLTGEDEYSDANGYFRSFPFHRAADGGIDGFFAARLIRN